MNKAFLYGQSSGSLVLFQCSAVCETQIYFHLNNAHNFKHLNICYMNILLALLYGKENKEVLKLKVYSYAVCETFKTRA